MPDGITTNQALTAISNACQAWADASSLTFEFDGIQEFGESAQAAGNNAVDGKMRIQIHDIHNAVSDDITGYGGRGYTYSDSFPNGGLGGGVRTNLFDKSVFGFVTLNHFRPELEDPVTLEETFCHEIGHVLSMGHSSIDSGETNNELSNAMMYFRLHSDGRGASLQSWDINVIQQIYPTNNTPPYGYNRMMDILTSTPQYTSTSVVNTINIRGYDREEDSTTLILTNATSGNGVFSISNNILRYTASTTATAARFDPAINSAYDLTYIQISDGTNLSPPLLIKVISLNGDFSPRDALPDAWASTYGVSNGSDDQDEDGQSNLQEWISDTDPTKAESALQITNYNGSTLEWHARGYELYELWSTTNLQTDFSLHSNPVTPTDTNGTITITADNQTKRFFQIKKVP